MTKLEFRPYMPFVKRVCVFCGSKPGVRASYAEAAIALARELNQQGLGLVYGGASVGLMGLAADTMLELGGEAIGVIPIALVRKEVAHPKLSEIFVVDTMHQRKFKMFELSDAFIALPGGFGTFDEFCEILTWSQIGYHSKPMGFLNVDGYFDLLLQQFDYGVKEGFILPEHRDFVLVDTQPARLLEKMKSYVSQQPPRGNATPS